MFKTFYNILSKFVTTHNELLNFRLEGKSERNGLSTIETIEKLLSMGIFFFFC